MAKKDDKKKKKDSPEETRLAHQNALVLRKKKNTPINPFTDATRDDLRGSGRPGRGSPINVPMAQQGGVAARTSPGLTLPIDPSGLFREGERGFANQNPAPAGMTPGATLGAGAPGAASAAQLDPIEQYIASLGAIDPSMYTRPFDDAAARARAAHAAGVPAINDAYGGLQSALQRGQQDLQGRYAGYQQALQQRQQGLVQQTQQRGADSAAEAAAWGVGGGLAQGLQAGSDGRAAAIAAQGASGADFMARQAQIAQESAAARGAEAGFAKSAALSTAQNNLSSILEQIGLKRTGAEQQAASDMAGRQQQIAQLRMQRDQAAAKAQAEAPLNQLKMLETLSRISGRGATGLDRFNALLPMRQQQAPKAVAAMLDLIENTPGKGALGRAQAQAMLDAGRGQELAAEGVDPKMVLAWLDEYYNDQPTGEADLQALLAQLVPNAQVG